MTTDELRILLEQMGLGQRAAARELDIPERDMRYFAAGKLPIPRVVEFAVRWLHQGRRT